MGREDKEDEEVLVRDEGIGKKSEFLQDSRTAPESLPS